MNDIIDESYSRCIFCLKPAARGAICSQCRNRHGLEAAWCVGERRHALKSSLDAFKFERVKAAAEVFAQLLDISLPVIDQDFVVTTVPSATSHIRQRGYAHMDLVAKNFARKRGLPFRAILEHHGNQTQHFKSKRQRAENARASLSITESPPNVLLIDDIVTTGATIETACRLLKEGGTRQLVVAAIARQPLD